MSIVLVGSTSGSITLQEPAVAGTTTIDLPATSGTVLVAPTALTVPNTTGTVMVSGNMPAFSVYRSSSQSVSTSTWTKVQFNAEDFDTANAFDSTTNYRFQPLVAGYYQLNGNIYMSGSALGSAYYAQFYKNGATFGKYSHISFSTTTLGDAVMSISAVVYLNGSTDYIEMYGYNNVATSPVFLGGTGGPTLFTGCLVRSA